MVLSTAESEDALHVAMGLFYSAKLMLQALVYCYGNLIGTPLAIDDDRSSSLARSTGLVWNLEQENRKSCFPQETLRLQSNEVHREEAMPQGPDELGSPWKTQRTVSRTM
jgi:hypothetical protein